MSLLGALADLFEKVADEEESKAEAKAERTETKAEAKAEEKDPTKEAAAIFREAMGVTDVDDVVAAKLAADPAAMASLRKIAEANKRPERLGGPSTRDGERPAPKTGADRVQSAYDSFGRFLTTGERSGE